MLSILGDLNGPMPCLGFQGGDPLQEDLFQATFVQSCLEWSGMAGPGVNHSWNRPFTALLASHALHLFHVLSSLKMEHCHLPHYLHLAASGSGGGYHPIAHFRRLRLRHKISGCPTSTSGSRPPGELRIWSRGDSGRPECRLQRGPVADLQMFRLPKGCGSPLRSCSQATWF